MTTSTRTSWARNCAKRVCKTLSIEPSDELTRELEQEIDFAIADGICWHLAELRRELEQLRQMVYERNQKL